MGVARRVLVVTANIRNNMNSLEHPLIFATALLWCTVLSLLPILLIRVVRRVLVVTHQEHEQLRTPTEAGRRAPRMHGAVPSPSPPDARRRPPMMHGALPSSSPAEESSPICARRQAQQQEQPRTEEIPPRNRRVIPPEHDIIRDEGPTPVIPPGPARRASLSETPINPPSPTGQRVRRAFPLQTIAGALKRCPGESKREKLKDLWRRARDRFGQW
ncbi:hypothetical protein L873DRAFT_469975 [Choiromyces venosus 120613-1]|uniref:Uncharacterized protein n=1 Tax=Choiromyces venosus 120613-1 TaxID=1336337 RepID=A0A3N4J153_9PEZI|nr:hypothetical protein L873DRAFT_469975 [Choiromyces venosus 120613-1]